MLNLLHTMHVVPSLFSSAHADDVGNKMWRQLHFKIQFPVERVVLDATKVGVRRWMIAEMLKSVDYVS